MAKYIPDALQRRDPLALEVKALVLIGGELLVIRRDKPGDRFDGLWDLPGGKRQGRETPLQTFQRILKDGYNIAVARQDVIWWRRYPNPLDLNSTSYAIAAVLPASSGEFADTGAEFMNPEKFLSEDTVPTAKVHAADFAAR